MSAEASGHVFRHSPYKGAAFAAHLAIADTVSDMNDNLFWMSQPRLAVKARASVRAIASALATLEADGWIERVEEHRGPTTGTVYRFLFRDDKVVVFDSRTPAKDSGVGIPGPPPATPAKSASTPATCSTTPAKSRNVTSYQPKRTQEEPKSATASLKTRPTDDPLVKAAHSLTVLAMEQPIKPVLRENGKGAFPAVMAIMERLLRAGTSVQAIQNAVVAGIDVWTVAGIQTAVAHGKPRRNPLSRGGPSLVELHAAAVAAENGKPTCEVVPFPLERGAS